ncbi:M14 family zinc carboxypeptidase [Roseisolibacter sp. H3M3-2]|uniref:M14 family zinc carboxypeptidase n=1 Tax=Roseisolibacter sp. H3M3-2 TaxID=3031323 RepID=UPI0023D97FA2|nr:M14 family zinc carboxypeptidase [Roseisolibacter sp. H3M3-2]MDF1504429.1 M14 family zinc carboxypeptidase [Roseisolibacter sp. H3M3-2]
MTRLPLDARRSTLALAIAAAAAAPAHAQHALARNETATYDPAVPTPQAVLGYPLGERFTPHHLLARYVERVALAAPQRVRLDTVARTFEGREVLRVIVASEANRARLAEIEADARRQAEPRLMTAAQRADFERRMPAVVWLGFTVHGNEASGAEAGMGVLYRLAAGRDAETRGVLDSVVVILDPLQNPDGHERHAQDVMRRRTAFGAPADPSATIHSGSWPGPRGSHYYFDLNRDWYTQSHPETRGRVATMLAWMPHVAADLHEMGTNSTYYFPPPADPVHKLMPPRAVDAWNAFAAGNAAAFDRNGWAYFRRERYDEFYPGFGESWPLLAGATGMTYEQASSAGGAIRRTDGTVLTLQDAASHHYAAAWATLKVSAATRAARVKDLLESRLSAITDAVRGGAGGPGLTTIRSVVLQRDAQGRADSLAAQLIANGISVRQARGALTLADATPLWAGGSGSVSVPAGAYVVDLAQPQGRMARALLEPEAVLDSAFVKEEFEARRTGQPDRFYDVTAWALPYTWRVRAWAVRAGVPASDTLAALSARAAGEVPTGGYGYAFAPGSEASLRLLGGLLADSVRIWFAPNGFSVGQSRFPRGAFVVRVGANDSSVHAKVRRHAAASGADVAPLTTGLVDAGTDLGSGSVVPVRAPRVALLAGDGIGGQSFGWTWYAFDQRLRYPTTAIDGGAVAGGALARFDVLVVPSSSAGGIDRALGDAGRERVQQWVRGGGVLVTLEEATAWLATERAGLSRLRTKLARARADGEPGAPLPPRIPGAAVRVLGDSLSPLLAGVEEREFPALANGATVYQAPRDARPGELAARLAPAARVRIAGFFWPESAQRIGGSPWLWTERVGQGRVIGFAADPNMRDQWRGMLPLFANAVFLGGTF